MIYEVVIRKKGRGDATGGLVRGPASDVAVEPPAPGSPVQQADRREVDEAGEEHHEAADEHDPHEATEAQVRASGPEPRGSPPPTGERPG